MTMKQEGITPSWDDEALQALKARVPAIELEVLKLMVNEFGTG